MKIKTMTKLSPQAIREMKKLYALGWKVARLLKKYKIGRTTFYRYLNTL
jgi:DNA invertase Pin-like site-specific DNA recombinase